MIWHKASIFIQRLSLIVWFGFDILHQRDNGLIMKKRVWWRAGGVLGACWGRAKIDHCHGGGYNFKCTKVCCEGPMAALLDLGSPFIALIEV
jgi:hypothetical protein